MTATREADIIEQEVAPTIQMVAGGSVDIQVATAKRFPRSITAFIQRATEMATLTPDVAASCVYALPRGGKTIEGPSARLAEIVANAWGNLRIQSGATDHDDRYITARGEAWDLEVNTAIGFEVRRRITKSGGQTYDDDMITVTGNAAASIALRNAVFKVVPSSFWKPIYQKCRQVIAGDARTFSSRRDEMMKAFMVMGVTEQRLCHAIGLKGKADITLEHMATLVGILNSIKEGETTIEDAFPEDGAQAAAHPQPAQRKSQQQPAQETGGSTAPAEPTTARSGADEAPNTQASSAPASQPAGSASVGTITDIKEAGNGIIVTLSTGFRASTTNPAFIRSLRDLEAKKRTVDLGTRPSKDPAKYVPVVEDITPMPEAEGAGQ